MSHESRGYYRQNPSTFYDNSANEARQRANILQSENKILSQQVRQIQQEYQKANGNFAHQEMLIARQQNYINRLTANEKKVEEILKPMAAEILRNKDATQNNKNNLASFKQAQAKCNQEVQNRVSQLRSETIQALDQAKKIQQQMEKNHQQKIAGIEHRINSDNQARLNKEQNILKRTEVQINIVEQRLLGLDPFLNQFDLDEGAVGVREQLNQARNLHAQGNGSESLAIAHTAFAKTISMSRIATRRQAELSELQEKIKGFTVYYDKEIKDNQLTELFPNETSRIHGTLTKLVEEADKIWFYRHYAVKEINYEKDLDDLYHVISDMKSTAPHIRQQIQERKRRSDEFISMVCENLGPLAACSISLMRPDDPKSPRKIELSFGDPKVTAYFDLEGSFSVDAHNFPDNYVCSQAAQKITEKLSPQVEWVQQHNDVAEARTNPSDRLEQRHNVVDHRTAEHKDHLDHVEKRRQHHASTS